MLIGGGNLEDASLRKGPLRARLFAAKVSALVLCVLLVTGVIYGVLSGQLGPVQTASEAFGAGSVQAIGQTLYTDYLLPFELASVLLLVGMVGAVALARKE